jgi:hypothetical protein
MSLFWLETQPARFYQAGGLPAMRRCLALFLSGIKESL